MTGNVVSISYNFKKPFQKSICLFKSDSPVLKPYCVMLVERISLLYSVSMLSIYTQSDHKAEKATKNILHSILVDVEGDEDAVNEFEKFVALTYFKLFIDRDDYRFCANGTTEQLSTEAELDCFSLGWIASIHQATLSHKLSLDHEGSSVVKPSELLHELGVRILDQRQTDAVCHGFEFGKAFASQHQLNAK